MIRMKKMNKLLLIAISIVLLLTGCGGENNISKGDRPIIYTSIYPLYFLAYEIGKENIDLRIVVPAGSESHDYEPSIKQLKDIEKADIFIYIGAGLETWADRLLNSIISEEKALRASDLVELIQVDGAYDPHIWLDPLNMIKIGEGIKDRLILLDGKNKDDYNTNFEQLSARLKELDRSFMEGLKDKKRDTILVSHAAFAYMAKRYDFKQMSVAGISPEQEPSPKTIADIIDVAIDNDFKYIFLETLANPKTATVIAEEANLEVLILNPIEGLTEEEEKNGEDYISIMEENLVNLEKALVR